MSLDSVLAEVGAERHRQDNKWGEQNHKDFNYRTYGVPRADEARAFCEVAFSVDLGDWASILLEEFCEAMECGSDTEHLREELIQLAAVCVSWVQAIDRR